MPRKKRKRVSVDAQRRARDKDAARKQARRNVRSIDRGVMGALFLASPRPTPRTYRFCRLRPREEAQAPPPVAAPQVPRRRPRHQLHRQLTQTVTPPPPPLRPLRRRLPRPSPPLRPLAPPAPRCKSCPWPQAPLPTVLRHPRPPTPFRRPREGCSLARPLSARQRPPCAAPLPPCSRTTPSRTTRRVA